MIERQKFPWLDSGETLVLFGDSLTAAADGYASVPEKRFSPKGVRVINMGRGGDKTPSALTRLNDVCDCKPDAVSIFFGTNDALIGHGIRADEPVVSPAACYDNLCWIVHLLRLRCGVRKFSIATPLWKFEGNICLEFGDCLTEYRMMARKASETMKTLPVLPDTAFELASREEAELRSPETGLQFTVDGIHSGIHGAGIIADTFSETWNMKTKKKSI